MAESSRTCRQLRGLKRAYLGSRCNKLVSGCVDCGGEWRGARDCHNALGACGDRAVCTAARVCARIRFRSAARGSRSYPGRYGGSNSIGRSGLAELDGADLGRCRVYRTRGGLRDRH